MRKEVVKAVLVVFVASFCTMVIELVAGRIMAPYVGVSLYTWTSIIGVVLAGSASELIWGESWPTGIPPPRRSAGCCSLPVWPPSPSPLNRSCGPLAAGNQPHGSHPGGHGGHLLCPLHALRNDLPGGGSSFSGSTGTSGNVVGKIYAFSTLGSILGTFATGFFLISWMGTRNILLLMSLI